MSDHDPPSVPTTQGEREACVVCGKPCEGTTGAVIDDVFQPMCHEGLGMTCYQRWMWDVSGVRPDITQIENQLMWEDDHEPF